jgi:hypothetical protein
MPTEERPTFLPNLQKVNSISSSTQYPVLCHVTPDMTSIMIIGACHLFVPKTTQPLRPHLTDNTVEPLLEPLDRLVAVDAVGGADPGLAAAAAADALAGAGHAAVEVHAVDADCRVVLDAQVDVLADAEAEVARLGEVALAQLVLLDLEAALEDLLGLGPADRDVHGDLFVAADAEGSDGVAGLACKRSGLELVNRERMDLVSGRTVDGRLTGQLLQHLGGTGQPVTRLAD